MEFRTWIEAVGNEVTAYHCGGQIKDGFSTNHIGGGEGKQILGPGIYFATTPGVAKMYCKYADEPYLHTVQLDTSNFYNPIKGTPHLDPQLDAMAVEMGFEDNWDMYQKVTQRSYVSTLGHGMGFVGAVVKTLGNQGAIAMFVKHGIQGALEIVAGFTEFSVFDPSVITPVSSEPQFMSSLPGGSTTDMEFR